MLHSPLSPSPLVNNWMERHRDPRSFLLHLVGIPCTIIGVLLMPIYLFLLSWSLFMFALILFVGGFGLQFLGHALEGSEPGEIKALRLYMARRREARMSTASMPVGYPEPDRA